MAGNGSASNQPTDLCEISLEIEVTSSLRVELGDTITWNVQALLFPRW